jgi:nucleoside-diphosphate-sugar epimerase
MHSPSSLRSADCAPPLTGGTGFLGAGILKELLHRGFHVRAAVRSERKAEHVRKQFQTYGDKLEFTFVEDITSDGAFDESVKGIDGIIHSAAPLPRPGSLDPNTFIDPSVNGTLSILKSALSSPTVNRVVITSSLFAAWESAPAPHVYTEVSSCHSPLLYRSNILLGRVE